MNTIDKLKYFIQNLNGTMGPHDVDSLHDFCITSFFENNILSETDFEEYFDMGINLLDKRFTKKEIKKYIEMYNNYIDFLSYLNKKSFLNKQ